MAAAAAAAEAAPQRVLRQRARHVTDGLTSIFRPAKDQAVQRLPGGMKSSVTPGFLPAAFPKP